MILTLKGFTPLTQQQLGHRMEELFRHNVDEICNHKFDTYANCATKKG